MKKRSNTYKVALCGVISALALVLMLLTGLIPVGTYAFPVFSGVLLSVIVIELNAKWAMAVYFAVSVLSFFLSGDKEAVLYFIAFFGFYPVLKGTIERIRALWVQYLLKYAVFNACIVGAFYAGLYLLQIPQESFELFGIYLPWVFLIFGNIVFLLYDKCVTILIVRYIKDLRQKIIK